MEAKTGRKPTGMWLGQGLLQPLPMMVPAQRVAQKVCAWGAEFRLGGGLGDRG